MKTGNDTEMWRGCGKWTRRGRWDLLRQATQTWEPAAQWWYTEWRRLQSVNRHTAWWLHQPILSKEHSNSDSSLLITALLDLLQCLVGLQIRIQDSKNGILSLHATPRPTATVQSQLFWDKSILFYSLIYHISLL